MPFSVPSPPLFPWPLRYTLIYSVDPPASSQDTLSPDRSAYLARYAVRRNRRRRPTFAQVASGDQSTLTAEVGTHEFARRHLVVADHRPTVSARDSMPRDFSVVAGRRSSPPSLARPSPQPNNGHLSQSTRQAFAHPPIVAMAARSTMTHAPTIRITPTIDTRSGISPNARVVPVIASTRRT
jgi:hypothetical protein